MTNPLIAAAVSALLSLNSGVFAADPKYAPDGKFLNVAILTLPDRYLADIPMEKRHDLLLNLSSGRFEDRRLDYANGWLNWQSDNVGHWNHLEPTSTFCLKLLRQKNGSWLTFVHMTKPIFVKDPVLRENQTFVLERSGGRWKDVTREVIPEEVDLSMHFRPHRSEHVIEVRSWKRVEDPGGGRLFTKGSPRLKMIWKEGAFQVENLPKAPVAAPVSP